MRKYKQLNLHDFRKYEGGKTVLQSDHQWWQSIVIEVTCTKILILSLDISNHQDKRIGRLIHMWVTSENDTFIHHAGVYIR